MFGAGLSPPSSDISASGIISSSPTANSASVDIPLKPAMSVTSTLYKLAIPFNVCPFVTVCLTPETGRIIRTSPSTSLSPFFMSFAHKIVFDETPNISAIFPIESSFLIT